MSLTLVATPIGNLGDITVRALEVLREADVVVGEERRELTTLLKRLDVTLKDWQLLNEHTPDAEVVVLAELCRDKKVALITDCGTPGFCDPGARLVAACRARGIGMTAVPGASSLMTLLSLSGRRIDQFLFRGFLPAENTARAQALKELKSARVPVVIMDTPYRLGKTLAELAQALPQARGLIGMDLTQPSEKILENSVAELALQLANAKAEFVLILWPN